MENQVGNYHLIEVWGLGFMAYGLVVWVGRSGLVVEFGLGACVRSHPVHKAVFEARLLHCLQIALNTV